jgi:hypothetical protein
MGIGIAGRPEDFPEKTRSTSESMFAFFENENRCALTHHEPVSIPIERTATAR